tara:strand:- start:21 stop:926 length:906 start_codon:yes stop_codon:yes gene_type:complete
MCFFGQSVVFEDASSLINSLTGGGFNAKQVERVCHLYGGLLDARSEEAIASGETKFCSETEKEELHYAMIDGAMYPTKSKEEPWKEVKLGRLFKKSDLLPFSENRNFITKSTYVAHLGEAKDFFPKFEYEVESLKNLVFLNDGGPWIWKWVESSFPNSVQILDYYHAKEHLCEFAKNYFKEEEQRKKWIEGLCETLLEKTPEEVVEEIRSLPHQDKTEDSKEKLINYYTAHLKRMQYRSFKEQGFLIGSGAIESAHRVYQQRFKLSGQHWTKKGLHETIQLKSAYQSKRWDKVMVIAKNAA